MAAAEAGRRSGLGWLILAAALAVPGFYIYTWWSHLKSEHDRGLTAKARNRVAEGSVFQTPPASARPLNAVAASSAAPNALPGQLPAAVPGSAPMNAASPAVPGQAPGAVPGTLAKTAPAAPAPRPVVAGGLPAVAASTGPIPTQYSAPVSTAAILTLARDPMMSPMDLVRQREAEAERERNAEALRRAAEEKNRPRVVHRVVKAEPKIDGHIELQGIVARPDGDNLAIVNGATVNPGEYFSVEGFSAKVKILRITSSEVTFEYKNRRFKKGVNAE